MEGKHLFSERTGWDREESPLAAALRRRRQDGLPVLDLTASNPTRCGFDLDADALLAPLAQAAALGCLDYDPQPFGRAEARRAIAAYYAERGAAVEPSCICLTASTSEAYSFLFRLLCNPGDEVLIASPSYPLFDYLAALDDVRLVPYPLVYDHGWHTVPALVEERVTPRTRAIALVHPNNPTGQFVTPAERAALERICARYGLALLVDEVFLDYGWEDASPASFAAGSHPALTFVLSGLSKIAGLPQMKLSWIAAAGPEALREEAVARLEVIADTFLSVSAPVQVALPRWLAECGLMQRQIRGRLAHNLAELDRLLTGTEVSRLAAEGGWYAVLRVPAIGGDEALAIRLLDGYGVAVHPGSAFGFGSSGWLVVSLLAQPDALRRGVQAILSAVSGGT